MNRLSQESIKNHDGLNDSCIRLDIDNASRPLVLHDILTAGQEYTFSAWVRSPSALVLNVCDQELAVSSDWQKKSVTFIADKEDLDITLATGLYYLQEPKLELGNRATAWKLADDDVVDASKTATNFLRYNNDGLLVANLTGDVLGKNVLISAAGIDLRNGSEILASYRDDTICLGKTDAYNTYITSGGIELRNGAAVLGKFTPVALTLGSIDSKNIYIDSNGFTLRDGGVSLALFTADEITLGQTATMTKISMLCGKLTISSETMVDTTFSKIKNTGRMKICSPSLELCPTGDFGVVEASLLLYDTSIDMYSGTVRILTDTLLWLDGPKVRIVARGTSSTWVEGRDNAILQMATVNNYSPVISVKTMSASWEIGSYTTFGNDLVLACVTDGSYDSYDNTTESLLRLNTDGYISGLVGCNNDWDVTGYCRTSNNFVCIENGHGLYGKHTDGTNMRIAVATVSSAGNEEKGDVNCTIHGDGNYRTYVVGSSLYHNQTWNKYSDRRLKTNFADLDVRYLRLFDNLSPVLYNLKNNLDKHRDIGYIAQDVLHAMTNSGINENENAIINRCSNPDDEELKEILTLDYNGLSIVATYALQNTRKRLKEVEEEIKKLKQLLRTS